MLLASAFITPFSAGVFGGMDEVMLNATLTVPTLLVARGGLVSVTTLFACLSLLYYVLPALGVSAVSPDAYLGGYQGAIFFLPILAAGAFVSNSWRNRVLSNTLAWGMVSIVLWAFTGTPDKLTLTPSFMALSCFVSSLTLFVLGRFLVTNNWMEYCGRNSLRMWCLMFALLAPARLYAQTNLHTRQLTFRAWEAVLIALVWMGISYSLSLGWDKLGAIEKAKRAKTRGY
jgi:hypothetical protein